MFSGKRSVNLGREVISEHKEKITKKETESFQTDSSGSLHENISI